jgi:hypothetical protein
MRSGSRHWTAAPCSVCALEERRDAEADLAGLPNAAAALFRLENARAPENIQQVVGCLVDWLAGPEHASLRRAFAVWRKRVLLPARRPGRESARFCWRVGRWCRCGRD